MISVLKDEKEDWSTLKVFQKKDASHVEATQAGEKLLLSLYGAKQDTEWGWELTDGLLSPSATDRAAAPERVLKIISCDCKVACIKKCN